MTVRVLRHGEEKSESEGRTDKRTGPWLNLLLEIDELLEMLDESGDLLFVAEGKEGH